MICLHWSNTHNTEKNKKLEWKICSSILKAVIPIGKPLKPVCLEGCNLE